MKRNFPDFWPGLAVMASAGLMLASANAAPVETPHDVAIKACSTVNPLQPVTVPNAVDDGGGIGFSLVWLTTRTAIFGCATPTPTATSTPTRS